MFSNRLRICRCWA